MGFNPNQGFSMPMFNPWVPEKVRPWIYLLFALFFQLSSGVYFGSLQQMVGATGFTREDMVMVAMFGVVGVNMPFPFLFRYKLRFTNQQLLINAACVIAVCNLLSLWLISSDFGEWRLPLLCIISYMAGYFKLCGTFECFSNIVCGSRLSRISASSCPASISSFSPACRSAVGLISSLS